MNIKIGYLKIDVSCEAFVNFQHISQNATPATEFARHVESVAPATQNDDGARQSAAPATKVERIVVHLPHKTICDTLWNMLECHRVPHLPRGTKLRDVWSLQKCPLVQNSS